MSTITAPLTLEQIERRICDITCEEMGFHRDQVSPHHSLAEDLGIDSLDLVELFMAIEKEFNVTLPADSPEPVFKAVFTRKPFRLSDIAELIYVLQGTGNRGRPGWRGPRLPTPPSSSVAFTQLSGTWKRSLSNSGLIERLDGGTYRRRSDGMRCLLLPSAAVEIGCNEGNPDENPLHVAELDGFLIDAEPVSTTAYSRFLNSIGPVEPDLLAEWFVLDPGEHRQRHTVVAQTAEGWHPVPGTERFPMVLVSWYGANAYSLWANGKDWRRHCDEPDEPGSFLPSEAQWEYAARGERYREYPLGDDERMIYGRHLLGDDYDADTMPMAAVNDRLGVSPFGLHHMAGNVWQWCRDWYDRAFYSDVQATVPNPLNRTSTGVRSERGGSWVGPKELCRSSFRRGRPPAARGRCLGFRCISDPRDVR
jgi:acyl carrier protein